MQFDTSLKTLSHVYDSSPTELDVWHGIPLFINITENVCIVYTEGHLLVFFWRMNWTFILTQVKIEYVPSWQ